MSRQEQEEGNKWVETGLKVAGWVVVIALGLLGLKELGTWAAAKSGTVVSFS